MTNTGLHHPVVGVISAILEWCLSVGTTRVMAQASLNSHWGNKLMWPSPKTPCVIVTLYDQDVHLTVRRMVSVLNVGDQSMKLVH